MGQRGKIPVGFPASSYLKVLNIVLGIIFTTFQGELRVETQQVLVRPDSGSNEKPKFDIDRGMPFQKKCQNAQLNVVYPPELKTSVSPFLFLAVDLPPPPLFQDAVEKNIIPQVSIHSVLAKYDGRTAQVGAFHVLSCMISPISPPGICWTIASIQVPAVTTLHYPPLQTFCQECIC